MLCVTLTLKGLAWQCGPSAMAHSRSVGSCYACVPLTLKGLARQCGHDAMVLPACTRQGQHRASINTRARQSNGYAMDSTHQGLHVDVFEMVSSVGTASACDVKCHLPHTNTLVGR